MEKNQSVTVTLDEPIQRGEDKITEVVLRRPKAGALRGVSLMELMNMQTDAIIKVVPRVSSPTLNEPDVAGMDSADLAQLGIALAGFFVPRAALEAAKKALSESLPE
ncbi:MAG TPA: phage tail assembly protein [Rhodocyclaceae bacterium]